MKVDEETLKAQDQCEFLRFLDASRKQGRCAGEGEITLDIRAAQEKLGRFRLPREHSWVLKFVQCANSLEVDRLDIRSGRRAVVIDFATERLPSLEIIKQGLDTFASCSQAEEHLRAALLALGVLPGQLRLEYRGAIWDGEDKILESEESGCFRCSFEYQHLEAFWSWLKIRLGAAAGIQWELTQHAYLAPVEVYLDSRRVEKDSRSIVLLNGVLNDRSGLVLRVGGNIMWGKDWPDPVFSSWARNSSPTFSYIVRADYLGPGRRDDVSLEWVRDGVVVERETREVDARLGVQLRVLLPADGLPTDLSGLSLRENAERHWRRRRATYYARHGLSALQERLGQAEQWAFFAEQLDRKAPSREQLLEEVEALEALLRPKELLKT